MDEFEQMWNTSVAGDQEDNAAAVIEETPEYLIRDGIARLKILSDMLINYYHAKYGEPLQVEHEEQIKFHLN